MKTRIEVTYDRKDVEDMCVKSYLGTFVEAPDGMEVVGVMSSYGGECKVEMIEKETPVIEEIEVAAPPVPSPLKEEDTF